MPRLIDSVAPEVKTKFAGLASQQARDRHSGKFYRFVSFPAVGMGAACGIAEASAEVGEYGVQHPVIHGCGGVVVEVDR